MTACVLAMNPGELPEAGGLLWQGRSEKRGVHSLEAILDERLLNIRREHMEWACATGQLQAGRGAALQSRLECGETPSMWWTSLIYERHPKLSPNLYIIYKLRCLELYLRESGHSGLVLKGGDGKLKKSISDLCRRLGIEFSSQPGARAAQGKGLLRKLYEATPAPFRAAARFIHWWWKIRRKLPPVQRLTPLEGGRPPATIATYFPNIDMRAAGEGRFRSRYWEKLHDALNAEARKERPQGPHFVRWLFIRFPSPDLDLESCIALRDLFQKEGRDGLSFNFLEEFLSAADIRSALWRWARLCVQSLRQRRLFAKNCRIDDSALDFWPWMAWQWGESLAGWRSLERCLFNRAFRNYSRLAGPQRWNLFPLENCPWERMLTIACRQIEGNGPVYGTQHSTIRPTDFRYFDAPQTFVLPDCAAFQPDVIAGNGESACSQWSANGMPEKRLRQVEALRYLYLAEARNGSGEQSLPPQAGEPLETGSGPRLLILTSFFAGETAAHLELVKEALDAGILRDYRLVLKPHPYLMPQRWLDSLPGNQKERIFVSNAPLALELRPGTNVWASNSTTASLEALLKKLPVMVMAARDDFDLCPVQNVPGLLRTGTLEDVRTGLKKLAPLPLEPDYLDLNPELPAWKELLDLTV